MTDRVRDRGMDRHLGLEPEPTHLVTPRLPRIDFDLATRLRSVSVFGAHGCRLHADGPDASLAAEQRAEAVHRGQEIPAVLLHHRQKQVASGVTGEPVVVLDRRQSRQQDASRLPLVARERQRALEHVARRQHAELVAQLPGAAAAVEHRDDGVETKPGVGLETTEQARKTRTAAETADVQLAQLHRLILLE